MAFESVIILGGLGQCGRLVARCFAESETSVLLVDRRERPECHPSSRYLQADVTQPTTLLLETIAAADCVVICLPEEIALEAAGYIPGAMADGSLWVDTLSVKSGICGVLRDCKRSIEIVSINPMFAPALGWRGHPVAAIELCRGPRSRAFLGLIESLGATIEMLTAETHDALTAGIQVATHAAILSFGATLLDMTYDAERGLHLATPPHRLLLALLSRIISGNPEVYWDIQHYHPEGARVRQRLANSVACLDAAASSGSPAPLRELFGQLRTLLSAREDSLQSLSDRIVLEAGREK